MNTVTFMPVNSLKPAENQKTHPYTPFDAQQSFSSVLKQSIEKINNAQIQSDVMTEKLARGESIDLHQVMITSQKASITMQAALEIRNKVIEAYQEAMRMQV
ncbi:flagellar hook-basal body protein FliE [Sporosarcina globispora]|uniref:Flagellar hook-basal body complex protein FliE n=1 Tax=Sporosarcina globispora TaxID=1459 RepID=A0A0M0GH49_SPOGL|nr:flagellar hook-basal body complex protein FliE [Sporosarcina globispora]KON89093.1 flagellar hook-basal body protein FliE [Sporosarcina globispora]